MHERVIFGSCPLCDCPKLADSVTADCSKFPYYDPSINPEMRWKRCTRCGHVFTEGYFGDAASRVILSKTHPDQEVGFELQKQRLVSARIIDRVLPYASQGAWLDVGFGNGSLLFTAQEYGFDAVGIDLRENNVIMMAALGIPAYRADLTALSLDFKCSVVSMADVLEHMPYPKKGLEAAHRLLADDGVLFVSLPNMDSILWKAADQSNANPYWYELEHYHNFTRGRLYSLLQEMGFEPVRYAVSERYHACMEVIARKKGDTGASAP